MVKSLSFLELPIQQHHRRLADILAGFETCDITMNIFILIIILSEYYSYTSSSSSSFWTCKEESVVDELLLKRGSSPLWAMYWKQIVNIMIFVIILLLLLSDWFSVLKSISNFHTLRQKWISDSWPPTNISYIEWSQRCCFVSFQCAIPKSKFAYWWSLILRGCYNGVIYTILSKLFG